MGLFIVVALAAQPTGTLAGRVVWVGPVPAVDPIPAAIPDGAGFRFGSKSNPFAPKVSDGGLAGAVVTLVGADPAAKPWPHPPVTVEQTDYEFKPLVAVARIGEPVTFVSRDPGPTTIRLRGAAFVTLPFPGPGKPTVRRLDKPGVVEATSGTMLTWAVADVVVSDHPFVAVTGADGRFELTGVPAGEYKLTCRVRDWREVGRDTDPETGLVSRRRFAPPRVLEATVQVPGEHTFTVDALVRSPKR